MSEAAEGATAVGGADGWDPDDVVGWTLVRTMKAMGGRFGALFDEMGLSAHEFGVLSRLRAQPGASQAAMAREIYVTPQSMGPIVAGLVDAGLVRREAPARRGGPAHLELTEAGHARVADAATLVARDDAAPSLGLDVVERAELVRLLHRVREHLEAEAQGAAPGAARG